MDQGEGGLRRQFCAKMWRTGIFGGGVLTFVLLGEGGTHRGLVVRAVIWTGQVRMALDVAGASVLRVSTRNLTSAWGASADSAAYS